MSSPRTRKDLSSDIGVPNPEEQVFCDLLGAGRIDATLNARPLGVVVFTEGRATLPDIALEAGANHLVLRWWPESASDTLRVEFRDIMRRPEISLSFGSSSASAGAIPGKVSGGEFHSGLGYFNTSPESPDGKQIAYVRWPETPKDDQPHPAELWVCPRDLSGHRKVCNFRQVANHNAAFVLWLDDRHIAYRDGGSICVVEAGTGKRLVGPIGQDTAMGHNAVAGRFLFAENADGSPLGGRGIYLVDAGAGTVERVIATSDLFSPKPGWDEPTDWCIRHPMFSPDGSMIAINLQVRKDKTNYQLATFAADGSDVVFFGPKPMHFAWFDDETILGHDEQVPDGQPDNWELRRWRRDGTFVETLAGTGCHFAQSPDNRWFASESKYGAEKIELKLYRRGETTPVRTLMANELPNAVWARHAHVNPAFSRDGRRVYFNRAVDDEKSHVFYSDISDLVDAPVANRLSLLHHETFDVGTLDNWVLELEQPEKSRVAIVEGKLDVDVKNGATIWFKPELRGDLVIEFDATMVKAGGPNDRVSDLNCFWMATDPASAEGIFSRGGRFGEYDNLRLYYVGMGGNGNRTTRFRKYHGDGAKPLLFEHNDAAHLLVPNRRYHVVIEVAGKVTRFSVDGEKLFEFEDPEPLREGRFGFRTVNSHLWIHDFQVFQLPADRISRSRLSYFLRNRIPSNRLK